MTGVQTCALPIFGENKNIRAAFVERANDAWDALQGKKDADADHLKMMK